MADASVAAIEFALSHECECPMGFLRCWFYGDFDAIRREWPKAPEAVFIGADTRHSKIQLFAGYPKKVIAEFTSEDAG